MHKQSVSTSIDDLLLAALQKGGDTFETGRHIVTFKENAVDEGVKALQSKGSLRTASTKDFEGQVLAFEKTGDADAIVFPEIRSALVGGDAIEKKGARSAAAIADHASVESIDPEYFVFSNSSAGDYLRGFLRAAETITRDLGTDSGGDSRETQPEVLGVTWGLTICRVPNSAFAGTRIKVAILDTGFDLGHPDFAGRPITSATFVGQPVQDLHGHGTHTAGTACGPKAPAGASIPRYGIAYSSQIFIGKVLNNAGSSVGASVLAGMNWAIANRCEVISMSLGGQGGVQPSYTAAGQAALNAGCLIIAASGNEGAATGFPANSPTIMSVAAVDAACVPPLWSNFGKVEIAGPGVNVFSSTKRPRAYATMNGTSMATPHVAGCAALWAQSNPSLRGLQLWRKLVATARHIPQSPARVGAGLVQAP